jgi:type I restriction enzyme S subunit
MVADLAQIDLPVEAPSLPDGWHYELLGSLVDQRGISYGIVQPGSGSSDGVPIVRVNNIRNGRVDTADVLRVDSAIESKFKRSRLNGGEVLLTLVGTLGEVAVAPDTLRGWNVARAVGVIPVRPDPGSDWVSICLRSSFVQHCIRMWATTTVQATFNLRDLAKLPIPIPPKHTREAIAAVLGALDDKIELNRRMNATLEAMARTLFQSWFVDFDPVRAKLDGRHPSGLDLATAALFPNEFENSELGHIPKGWKTIPLGELADLNWGDTTITKASYVPSGFRAFSASGADGFLPRFDFDRTGVVISAIGANAGVTWLAHGKWSCIKNTLRFWATVPAVSTEFLFFATYGQEKWPQRGSAQPFISQGDARALLVLVPTGDLAERFGTVVRPWLAKIEANEQQSRTLANLRDTLLPRLLSGELMPTLNSNASIEQTNKS